MGKIVEFENVYIEYPDELVNESELSSSSSDSNKVSATQKLSKEELQRKLEETQSLHL